jgi:hypothetical protein
MIYPVLATFIYSWTEHLLTTVISQEQPWMRNSQTNGLAEVDLASQKPQFNCSDFCVWGYIKNIVSAEEIRPLQHLKDRICTAIETVMPDMLSCVWKLNTD